MRHLNLDLIRMQSDVTFKALPTICNRRAKYPTRLTEEQCDICGDYHESDVPRECETGDGI